MKICAISDVHGKWNQISIPEVDLLISCGDYSFKGEKHMVRDFHKWLSKQKARHIISVQGNHELWVEKNFDEARQIALEECPNVNFMQEGLVEIEGIKIWCSAWTPFFHNWAWNAHRGEEINAHWDLIPEDIDVLVTHGPPADILDVTMFSDGTPRDRVGCYDLWNKILKLPKLKMHFFGHIHESYGYRYLNGIQFYNVAICDQFYKANNEPVLVEL